MCELPPINQPPKKPTPPDFTGGQCPCVLYNVRYRIIISSLGYSQDFWSNNRPGKILGSRERFTPSPGGGGLVEFVIRHNVCSGSVVTGETETVVNQFNGLSAFSGYYAGSKILYVQRVSGVDNCGNLPTEYPPTTPPPSQTFNVNIKEDNDTSYTFPITWNGSFTLPLVFVNNNFKAYLDFGGINFEWKNNLVFPGGDTNPYPTIPPRSRPPWSRPPGGGGSNPSPGDEGVEEKDPVDVTPEEPLEEEDSPEETILWIKIEIIDFPPERFIIRALNAEDNTYFPGYLSWTKTIGSTRWNAAPEMPIRRRITIIRKPDDYNGYKIRTINGASLRVTQYTERAILE
jgi:hypothetical protein